jgi:hypothetical protein
MKFEIIVDVSGRPYKMQVEKIYEDSWIEKFRVTGGNKSIVIQSNRPRLKAMGSTKQITWDVVEGEIDRSPERIEATTMALFRMYQGVESWLAEHGE